MSQRAGASDSTDWARAWSEELLGTTSSRWRHTQAVATAAQMGLRAVPDAHAMHLVAAAWLHDIGYAPALHRTEFHPVDGAEFLASNGASSLVVSLVAHHSCSRFEAAERGLLDELARFPKPPVHLADALIYADMTCGPTGETVTVDDRIAEILTRYPDDDPVHRAITAAAQELRAAVARVQQRLAEAGHPM